MKRTSIPTAAVVALAVSACQGARADADGACASSCERAEAATRALGKDFAVVERAADELDKIEVTDDAQIRPAAERAQNLCNDVATSVAHARGILWAFQQEKRALGDAALDNDLGKLAESTKACAGRSPAQLKSAVVGPARATTKKLAPTDVPACVQSCAREKH
jgi:hypothetical protein